MNFVSVQNLIDYVGSVGVEPFLSDLAAYVESDFGRWALFEKAPRYASHSNDGVIELMPASDGNKFGFKYVNGHPRNFERGLQTVCAFGVLSDVATGYPELLCEMTLLTALRTAATSAVAAKALARPDAHCMAIIGLGAQSEFQALGFKALLGIRKLRIFDIDPGATAKFLRNMALYGLDITVARSAEEASFGADIVTTVTADKRRAHIVSDNMIGSGVHLNAVGGDCPGKTELQASILKRASVFVEFEPQTRMEGEIQQMPADFPVTELWKVISKEHPGRRRRDEITVFDSVGFALEDFSALRFLSDRLKGSPYVSTIDLIAAPSNPRNLFGLLNRQDDQRASAA